MKYVGAHVSAEGGVQNAPVKCECNRSKGICTFHKESAAMVFKSAVASSISEFRKNCEKFDFKPFQIFPHDSYLINLGHPEKEPLEKSRTSFLDEMKRCELLGLDRLNFHPGQPSECNYNRRLPEENCGID